MLRANRYAMTRHGSTKELLEILSSKGAATSPKTGSPSRSEWRTCASPVQCRWAVAAVLGCGLLCLLFVRWVTFEPTAYARSAWQQFSAVPPGLGADHKAIESHFHHGPLPCARYSSLEQFQAPAQVDEAVEDILSSGLVGKIDELGAESSRWEQEKDKPFHAADQTTEVLEHVSAHDTLWNRIGVWMRRDATLEELRATMRPTPAFQARRLSGNDQLQAKALWSRHGFLTPALLRITRWLLFIDLAAPHLRLVHPDMTDAQAAEILRDSSIRSNARQSLPDVRVSIDDQHRVAAVRWQADASGQTPVFVGNKMLYSPGKVEVIAELGLPLVMRDEDVLSYDRGTYRQRILFSNNRLSAVELWRADLIDGAR
jgi:hypothetical protein